MALVQGERRLPRGFVARHWGDRLTLTRRLDHERSSRWAGWFAALVFDAGALLTLWAGGPMADLSFAVFGTLGGAATYMALVHSLNTQRVEVDANSLRVRVDGPVPWPRNAVALPLENITQLRLDGDRVDEEGNLCTWKVVYVLRDGTTGCLVEALPVAEDARFLVELLQQRLSQVHRAALPDRG